MNIGGSFNGILFQENRIEGEFRFEGELKKLKLKEGKSFPPLVISANRIGGGFVFWNSEVNAEIQRLDLSYNRAEGYSMVYVSPDWNGQVDLTNGVFSSLLRLARYDPDAEFRYITPDDIPLEEKCEDVEAPDKQPDLPLMVNMTGAQIVTLAWNLSLNCENRWEGAGLRYKYWGDADLKAWDQTPKEGEKLSDIVKTEEDFLERLQTWRYAMAKPDVDALTYMADYLESRGRLVESREIRREAKRQNYTRLPEQPDWVDYLKSRTLLVLLSPGGYGANPEWAAGLLFIGWFGFGVFYCGYSRTVARKRETDPPAGAPPAGFLQIGQGENLTHPTRPRQFSVWRYSLDAMLPVINLHAYDRYYLEDTKFRWIPGLQHVFGWWWTTVLIASASIL